MDRRKAMKIAAGAIAGSGAGLFALSKAFKPGYPIDLEPRSLEYTHSDNGWQYSPLNPSETASLAYDLYPNGSCMYAIFRSVISQLADKFGEPYASFPYHMFSYGHGGIGGFGTVCGALNGAAALIGLFITERAVSDRLITDIFQWQETEPLPKFKPVDAELELPAFTANSVLCHASNTNWSKDAGVTINSKERRERCRRLTCDVAAKTVESLNALYNNDYLTNTHGNETVQSCMACHGDQGKMKNTAGRMSCNSCHTESAGHRVFSDIHYKLMKEK